MPEEIQIKLIEEEMKEAYMDYAMSVIVSRALPEVRDGLKPVHRRILYTMYEEGMRHDKPFRKSAATVGAVMAKRHPHGNVAIYDALVRLAQDFSLRYPLIEGHGNFGCFTGDTKIKLLDSTSKSFKELCEIHSKDEIFYVYSVDKDGNIVIGEARNPRVTKKNAKLVEVTLDNGEKIKCTPDHRFLLKNLQYKVAKDLTPSDSLMPGYFRVNPIRGSTELKDYLMIKDNSSGKYVFVHEITSLAKEYNHRITSVKFLDYTEDVYDITVNKYHNFLINAGIFVHNSVEGFSPAAERYTEARLNMLAGELLQDIEKDTVNFVPNFDGTTNEPVVLPGKIPNLLINGSSGIAVGMATNIPSHNINDVVDAIIMNIENPAVSINELIEILKGPDFPTGGLILNKNGIVQAYKTGRGKIIVRADAHTKDNKVIITEIPYQVNKTYLIESIANLVREKRIEGIVDIRDESDSKGMSIVIEAKKDANTEVILNQLYKNTQMQITFGIIMLVLDNGQPKIMNLKQIIDSYVQHRKDVITRKTSFDLNKSEQRLHILEGLKIALQDIDSVVDLIKKSNDVDSARSQLINRYSLSKEQAQAILDMRLHRLTSLEQSKIKNESSELVKLIKDLKDILSSEKRILGIIKNELFELKEKYGDERRTEILDLEEDIEVEDLIEEENVVITATYSGYIKQIPLSTYRQQKRGGLGIKAATTKEDDVVEHLFVTSNHNYLLFFTNKGKVYWLKAYEIPEATRQSRGKAIINLLNLDKEERINTILPISQFDDQHYLLFATKNGMLKKTLLSYYSKPRKGGIIAINLRENDELVQVRLTPGNLDLILGTKRGLAIRFNEADIAPVGRDAIGVRGIRLHNDEVVGMEIALNIATLLTITENGYGKRTNINEYRLIKRGGKGVINIQTKFIYPNSKNEAVVGIKTVKEDDEIMVISKNGIMIRIPVREISNISRNTQGVRIMKLRENDKVVTIARVIQYNQK